MDFDSLPECEFKGKVHWKEVDWDSLEECPKDYSEDEFSFAPFIGKQVTVRATINNARIHILNFYGREYGKTVINTATQRMIDEGIIIPRVNLKDEHEGIIENIAFLNKYIVNFEPAPFTMNKLLVTFKVNSEDELGKLYEAFKQVGVNMKYELAAKDELNTESNIEKSNLFFEGRV